MKLVIDIPTEFESRFDNDKFKDSFKKIKVNLNAGYVLVGNCERELLDMLIVAFEDARIIESSRSRYNS